MLPEDLQEPPAGRPAPSRSALAAGLAVVVLIAAAVLAVRWLTDDEVPPPDGEWTLTFRDEFDGGSLDAGRWSADWTETGFTTTTHFLPEQVSLEGGRLRLIAERKPTPSGREFASGLIHTRGKFEQRYGRFEMRAKLPAGQALWPAFWLLPPDDSSPEIDVMEGIGQTPKKIFMTVHSGDGARQGVAGGADFSKDFHTYAVEWSPGRLTWEIDGVERFSTTGSVPAEPMYLIVDLAVGWPGDPDEWVGAPDATTPSPASFEIDYVRAYARR